MQEINKNQTTILIGGREMKTNNTIAAFHIWGEKDGVGGNVSLEYT